MVRIFVDTNYILQPYQSNNTSYKEFFKDLRKAKGKLVVTDQLIDEFYRNRDVILRQQIKLINQNFIPNFHTSTLIREFDSYKKMDELKKEFELQKKHLITDFSDILDNPDKDEILIQFKETYTSRNSVILKRDDEIIKRAHNRKLIGNPPSSKKTDTIGDETHWELLLENINEDLVIVSYDGTFKEHSAFLIDEFKRKTGKKLNICDKLSEALALIGETASEETKEFEKEALPVDDVSEMIDEMILMLAKDKEFRKFYFETLELGCQQDKYNEIMKTLLEDILDRYNGIKK